MTNQTGVELFITARGIQKFKVVSTSKKEMRQHVFWIQLLYSYLSEFEDELELITGESWE